MNTNRAMLILSEAQVRQCLTMDLCISANRLALSALRSSRSGSPRYGYPRPTGTAVVPTRVVIPQREVEVKVKVRSPQNSQSRFSNDNGIPSSKSVAAPDMTLFKPAAYYPSPTPTPSTAITTTTTTDTSSDETVTVDKVLMGMKLISVRSKNPSMGKPSGPATITLLDAETGEITSIIGATYLTAARTAAGSAIATKMCLGLGEFQFQSQTDKTDTDTDTEMETQKSSSTSTSGTSSLKNLHLLIVGAGLQAELHALAMRHILGDALTKMTILNRTWGRANRLKERMLSLKEKNRSRNSEEHGSENENVNSSNNEGNNQEDERRLMRNVEIDVMTFDGRQGDEISASSSSSSPSSSQLSTHKSLQETIHSANIICTATNTTTPLINWDWVQDGCHINGVGSYLPSAEEVDKDFIANRCITMCDTLEALDVGDLKYVQEDSDEFLGLVGDLLASSSKEREGDEDAIRNTNCDSILAKIRNKDEKKCTFFKSVGTAIQDIVTANSVVDRAQRLGVGTSIDMS
mmetsp:Transcript_22800/g.34785  ORF Transcript_22800/g.34785 Transcript_22800/m.34785 type:complete len:521 (-) Transcript_22800:489-2051(-)|eukprot:CAMPEP_0194116710 /NCGR_PEP_ID=MMETSP0150-20130528/28299_1 /TAXON_ID=122233 /ORGANISM="Chaetoceros debilis, Strain MM31A-1" /LENGTH=520 /DNA_ID=CAMNT_0038807495 /DNA_START=36 /DNA_END=1598 /DNA_ORIENTATION=+